MSSFSGCQLIGAWSEASCTILVAIAVAVIKSVGGESGFSLYNVRGHLDGCKLINHESDASYRF